ncbi:peptidylprolyl isomerase [Shewanella maritima]|uniref:peptidylprolyl isomerase n=1 Tax=Shewanella maritima TaxID=2520507 RepID=UPI003734ECA9
MKHLLPVVFVTCLTACGGSSDSGNPAPDPTPTPDPVEMVISQCFLMETTMGDLTLGIDTTNTPITGNNFIDYAESGFYDGTIFHRIVNNFVNQGGGATAELEFKDTQDPITNESSVGLKNERGTIAMARTQSLDSATSQFFFNIHDNTNLDYPNQGGYAVFGKIVQGIEFMDTMNAVNTHSVIKNGVTFTDVPVTDIVINKVSSTTCPSE